MYCLPVLQITESDQILPNLSKSDRTWPDLFLPVTPYGIWLFWEHMTSSDSSQPSVISITLHSSQWLVKFVSSAFREHAHRIALTRSLFSVQNTSIIVQRPCSAACPDHEGSLQGSTDYSAQLNVYLPITENIHTTVQHQMAGCQRGLSLSKLATHCYNNVITTHINA